MRRRPTFPASGFARECFRSDLRVKGPRRRNSRKKKSRRRREKKQQTLRLLFDANHLRQINLRFHGRPFLHRHFCLDGLLVFFRAENRAEAAEGPGLADVAAVPLGRGDLTVNPPEEGRPPPRRLPLQPLLSLSCRSLGTTHPGCPLSSSSSPSSPSSPSPPSLSVPLTLSSSSPPTPATTLLYPGPFQELPVSPG